MQKDSVIILSGGLDSSTLLHQYASRIAFAVTFDYGSNHNAREIECARAQTRQLGIEHIVIPLSFMGRYFKSSLLEGADAVPDAEYAEQNMRSTVVPFRNGIMIAVAAGLAESRGLQFVMMASHGGDHALYPDCRAEFVEAMGEATRAGTYARVSVLAPYTGISKAQIAAIGKRLGMDYTATYSCYRGAEHHCGRCATCRERHAALIEAGIPDLTVYDSDPELTR